MYIIAREHANRTYFAGPKGRYDDEAVLRAAHDGERWPFDSGYVEIAREVSIDEFLSELKAGKDRYGYESYSSPDFGVTWHAIETASMGWLEYRQDYHIDDDEVTLSNYSDDSNEGLDFLRVVILDDELNRLDEDEVWDLVIEHRPDIIDLDISCLPMWIDEGPTPAALADAQVTGMDLMAENADVGFSDEKLKK